MIFNHITLYKVCGRRGEKLRLWENTIKTLFWDQQCATSHLDKRIDVVGEHYNVLPLKLCVYSSQIGVTIMKNL